MSETGLTWWREKDGQPRFGNVKVNTIRRDFDKLRAAIRAHNPEVTEAAWEKCERWLEALPLPAPPAD